MPHPQPRVQGANQPPQEVRERRPASEGRTGETEQPGEKPVTTVAEVFFNNVTRMLDPRI